MLKVTTRPHEAVKTVFGKAVKVSFNQEYVDWEDDNGSVRHIGYLHLISKCFTGLSGFPKEFGAQVAQALTKRKGYPVAWAGAPELHDPEPKEEEDDE